MKYKETKIAHGGLMRCCIHTICEHIEDRPDEDVPQEPLVLDCKHEKAGNQNIVLKDGVWSWNSGKQGNL